jgi:hypothetical protein
MRHVGLRRPYLFVSPGLWALHCEKKRPAGVCLAVLDFERVKSYAAAVGGRAGVELHVKEPSLKQC